MNKNIINRKIQPAFTQLHFNGFPEFKKELLTKEIPCYCFHNPSTEVIKFNMVIKAGSWSQQKLLQAQSMARLMTEGTKTYNAYQIAEIVDFNGAYLDITSSFHQTIINIVALKHSLKNLIPLLKSILTESIFPEEELKIILANNKQDFIVGSQKVMTLARRIFPSMIYGENHPYGSVLKESDFDNISANDLVLFYNNLPLNSLNCYLSGNIDSNTISLLKDLLMDVTEADNNVTENHFEIIASTEKEKLIEVDNAVQSAIILGTQVIGRTHRDFPLLYLTNTILGGYFGSRLMKAIREEKGYTYGISSGITFRKNASHLSIQTEVKSQTTNLALDEIFNEILRLSVEKVSLEELDIARNYIFGSQLRNMDGAFALSDRLMSAHSENIDPYKYYRYFWDTIANATPSDVIEMTKKYLVPDKMRVLIVGNKN